MKGLQNQISDLAKNSIKSSFFEVLVDLLIETPRADHGGDAAEVRGSDAAVEIAVIPVQDTQVLIIVRLVLAYFYVILLDFETSFVEF